LEIPPGWYNIYYLTDILTCFTWDQGFGSGSGLDPDSIRSVDPDPYSESGSGSRRAKMTQKVEKNLEISCFEVLDVLF
jgi:hypothetical protein